MNTAAFFDIDNTLIDGYSQVLFAKYLMSKKQFPPTYYFFIILWYLAYKLKLTNNSSSIRDFSIRIIKGWAPSKLKLLARECFEYYIKPRIYQESGAIIQNHRRRGAKVILVSSSLDVLVDVIKEYICADDALYSELEMQDGVYTGKIVGEGMYGSQKAVAIKNMSIENNIDLRQSYAYADHISDLPLLELVGNPIAVNPDVRLADICKQRHWKILYMKRTANK